MNRLSSEARAQIIAALVEGNSIRATCRMTGVSKNTVTKLLVDLGTVCSGYQDKTMRNLNCGRLQVDEIWAFVGAKQRNVPEEKQEEWGDVWTWVVIDADTKLVPTWMIGERTGEDAARFMQDIAARLTDRTQLTTDAFPGYKGAVRQAFPDIDYGQIQKTYGSSTSAGRYSPGVCTGSSAYRVFGDPDPNHISTSYVERQNLTMRMSMRRFTRLTNAFSKKVENLAAAVSLHFMHYNFCRVHSTLGTTPAVAAGVADHPWKVSEIIDLLDQAERAVSIARGPYKKRAS